MVFEKDEEKLIRETDWILQKTKGASNLKRI